MAKNNVSYFRKLNNYTQKDMATVLGMVESNYSKKENGKVNFTLDDIMILLEMFKCSFEDLFIKDIRELISINLAR